MRCWFFKCKWLHKFNVENPHTVGRAGVYQCTRCKTLSVGSPR